MTPSVQIIIATLALKLYNWGPVDHKIQTKFTLVFGHLVTGQSPSIGIKLYGEI